FAILKSRGSLKRVWTVSQGFPTAVWTRLMMSWRLTRILEVSLPSFVCSKLSLNRSQAGSTRKFMLFTLLAFAVALGVLITFHELGHYWVARRCGVKVLRFSVGFGKVLLRRVDRHGTEWAVSAIPL